MHTVLSLLHLISVSVNPASGAPRSELYRYLNNKMGPASAVWVAVVTVLVLQVQVNGQRSILRDRVAMNGKIKDVAGWPSPQPDGTGWWVTAGNHRLEIVVSTLPRESANVVQVVFPWRRTDGGEEVLNIESYIVSAESQMQVNHCLRANATLDESTFFFDASSGPGVYFIYYMPFHTCEYAGGPCEYNAQCVVFPAGFYLHPTLVQGEDTGGSSDWSLHRSSSENRNSHPLQCPLFHCSLPVQGVLLAAYELQGRAVVA